MKATSNIGIVARNTEPVTIKPTLDTQSTPARAYIPVESTLSRFALRGARRTRISTVAHGTRLWRLDGRIRENNMSETKGVESKRFFVYYSILEKRSKCLEI